MKTFLTFLTVAVLSTATAFADDAALVANWKFPIAWWFPNGITVPASGAENSPKLQALADSIGDFDPLDANFDQVWNGLINQGINGNGYPIAMKNGNSASDNGETDFSGAFKVVYDQNNFYILIKYADDDLTGSEVVELMWAPYYSIPEIESLTSAANYAKQASHARYAQFGANKAAYSANGFTGAMMVSFDATGLGSINWSGTNQVLSSSLFIDNKTVLGSKTYKAIYTIGYQSLTGNAFSTSLNARTNFNTTIWRTLNSGKGISFDIKIADKDLNDQLNTAASPVEQPQEYWWNSSHNDGYAETYYSGFLGIRGAATAINILKADETDIFRLVSQDEIQFTEKANVEVYNLVGKCLKQVQNVEVINLTDLTKGIYIVRANNQTIKVSR